MKRIEMVGLEDSEQLTDAGVMKLSAMKKLKKVWINECPKVTSDLDKLRRILPQGRVELSNRAK